MIVLGLAAAMAESPPRMDGSPHAAYGARLDADGVGGSVSVGEEWVVGGDGRTAATRVSARWASARWALAAHLPFVTYAVPGPDGSVQRTGLGNLRLDLFRRYAGDAGEVTSFGAQVHLPLGDAYTWTHAASGIWPGAGVTAVVQRRQPIADRLDLLLRGAAGVHGTGGFAPFPRLYVQGAVTGGLDASLPAGFGLLGELSLTYWDPSPIDLAAWVRSEPGWAPGLRARLGAVAPVGTWAGLSPSDRPAGVRELTLLGDLSAAF